MEGRAFFLYIALEGAFQVKAHSGSLIGFVRQGDVFGESSLFGRARVASVESWGESRAALYRPRDLRPPGASPEVDYLFLQKAAQRALALSRVQNRLHESVADRIGRVLLDVAQSFYSEEITDERPRIVPLTQQELAELTGLSRETINKFLNGKAHFATRSDAWSQAVTPARAGLRIRVPSLRRLVENP